MTEREGNILIAKFMGYTYFPHGYSGSDRPIDFRPGWKRSVDDSDIRKFNELRFPFEPYGSHRFLTRNHNGLKYSESWDWLMPVVHVINGIGKAYHLAMFPTYYAMSVKKSGTFHTDFSYSHSTIIDPSDPIKALFDLIIHFLDWYNKFGIVK